MLICLFLIRIGRLKMLKLFFPTAARTEMTRIINLVQVPGADPGFGQGGTPASEAESCRRSEAESHE